MVRNAQSMFALGSRHGREHRAFILRELQRELQQDGEPDHWFWALVAITRENPSVPEDRGNILKMARAWLRWGVNRGYLSGQALGADVS